MDAFSSEISHVRPANDSMIMGDLSNTISSTLVLKGVFRTLQNCFSKLQLELMELIFLFLLISNKWF